MPVILGTFFFSIIPFDISETIEMAVLIKSFNCLHQSKLFMIFVFVIHFIWLAESHGTSFCGRHSFGMRKRDTELNKVYLEMQHGHEAWINNGLRKFASSMPTHSVILLGEKRSLAVAMLVVPGSVGRRSEARRHQMTCCDLCCLWFAKCHLRSS